MSVATIPASRRAALQIPRPSMTADKVLWVLLALALVRGLLYAVLNPPFASPDELAHFQYVAYLATNGASGPIGDEGHQPVLYYALMVPAYWLTSGQPEAVQLLAIRIASIPFLLGTVLFTWLAARKMAPSKPFVPIVAAALVALLPELAYFGASANNDNAANLVAALLTYLAVALISSGAYRWTAPVTAVAIGVSLVTKGQILPVVMISAAVLAGHTAVRTRPPDRWKLALYAAVPLLLAAALLDGRAGERMMEVAATASSMLVDWPKASAMAQQSGTDPFSYMFTSFWAAFIGESVRPADRWYLVPAGVVLLGGAGYLVALVSGSTRRAASRSTVLLRTVLLGMLAGVLLTAYLRYLYNYQFADQPWRLQILQGRFLHVAIAPLALLVGEGWGLLTPSRARAGAGWGILGLLIAFDVASLVALASHYAWP